MIGRVDEGRRALCVVLIKSGPHAQATSAEAWIDTGFTGELVLPQTTIDALGLANSGTLGAQLGDGSRVILPTYACTLEWMGQELAVEVLGSAAGFPLIGVGLLLDCKLTIDYQANSVTLD